MRKIVLAALFAATAATPALAQDAAPFTGLRAEGIVGYDRINDGSDADIGADGVAYGAQVGYDFQAGGVILGVEGEITESSISGDESNVFNTGDNFRLSVGRDLYAGGRVGFALSPTSMIYGKVGYTNTKIKARYSEPGFADLRTSAEADGFRVGGGAEFQLSRNLYAKGEYRYSNYGEIDDVDVDIDRHQVLGGVGIRF